MVVSIESKTFQFKYKPTNICHAHLNRSERVQQDGRYYRSLREDGAVRSALPQPEPDALLLPVVSGFPSLPEGARHRLRTVPVLQEGVHVNVPERLGREVGRPDRVRHVRRPHLEMCERTEVFSEQFAAGWILYAMNGWKRYVNV